MNIEELKKKLNEIAWDEQVLFEVEESYGGDLDDDNLIDEQLRALAQLTTPLMLDALEKDYAYITWALRLSPFVTNGQPRSRAHRFVHHENSQVRYWANLLLQDD